jgi:hypothetical protein
VHLITRPPELLRCPPGRHQRPCRVRQRAPQRSQRSRGASVQLTATATAQRSYAPVSKSASAARNTRCSTSRDSASSTRRPLYVTSAIKAADPGQCGLLCATSPAATASDRTSAVDHRPPHRPSMPALPRLHIRSALKHVAINVSALGHIDCRRACSIRLVGQANIPRRSKPRALRCHGARPRTRGGSATPAVVRADENHAAAPDIEDNVVYLPVRETVGDQPVRI